MVTHPKPHTYCAIQGFSIRPFPDLVNFVPAVAYFFCLNLNAAFSQPGKGLIEIPCRVMFHHCLGDIRIKSRAEELSHLRTYHICGLTKPLTLPEVQACPLFQIDSTRMWHGRTLSPISPSIGWVRLSVLTANALSLGKQRKWKYLPRLAR